MRLSVWPVNLSQASGWGPHGNDLLPLLIKNRDRIHRAGIARPQQSLALDGLRGQEHRHGPVVQLETFGRLLHAVPEPHALVAVDHDAQPMDQTLSQRAHIPSSPSSPRAVSITAGVISAMLRCLA